MGIKSYDTSCSMGIHTVRITVQQGEYVGHITNKVRGICKGRDVMDFDFEYEDEESLLENDCDLVIYDDGYISAALKDNAGNTLICEDYASEFNKMIVAVEIIDFAEEAQDESNTGDGAYAEEL